MDRDTFNMQFTKQKEKDWVENIDEVVKLARIIKEENTGKTSKEIKDLKTKIEKLKSKIKGLKTKITNASRRTGGFISEQEILDSIIISNTAAYAFAKDPLRQDIAENFQYDWIVKNKNKPNLRKLSSGGSNAIYLVEGEIVTGMSKKPGGSKATKSIDFQNDNEYYYAKYTETCGGAQDNQCNDGKKFVEQANLYCNKHQDNKVFILLVDGGYYTEEKKLSIRSTISEQNRHRVRVCGSYEV